MARFFYTLFFYLIMPLVLLRLLWRAYKAPAYVRRWSQRFGFFSKPAGSFKQVICLHSVSVGESIAAAPLVKNLQQLYPEALLVVTTTTPTGSAQVIKQYGDSVFHVYLPYDLPDAIARFLNRLQVDIFLVMETELWPNLIAACNKRNIPCVLLNGRMSEKSARGYKKLSALSRPMMAGLDQVLAQSEADAERFVRLGVSPENCLNCGNIKFDLCLDAKLRDKAEALQRQWKNSSQRPIWLVASTHPGEDEQALAAFATIIQSYSDCLMVLVPRHPERFKPVAELCIKQGFQLQQRSENVAVAAATQVLLGDSMGEMLAFYGACDIAFVGGSLVDHGGHNMIEPAAWAKPIITGPSDFNFTQTSALLLNKQALIQVEDVTELTLAVSQLLENPAQSAQMGQSALAVANANRGALDSTLANVQARLAL